MINNMITQILTSSSKEYNFIDWGDEHLLLAIEQDVPYVEGPPVMFFLFHFPSLVIYISIS